MKAMRSKYPLRSLGVGESEVLVSEEERESHVHLLGSTGEGKSRLIEHLIREDIRRGNGVCLLDPTDRAETAYNILRFCAQEGIEKVCLVDPFTLRTHNRITAVQPFHYTKSYRAASVANILDTVRVLFQTKDASETPRIQRYLSALLNVLWRAEMTLHEAVYFTDWRNFKREREEILWASHPKDRHRLAIEAAFRSEYTFNNELASTVRRLEPFFDSTLDLMYGADYGIPFMKMISEGWVVLVNLYSGLGVEPIHTRLLGTTVINELIFALDRLRNRGWRGAYYLYIDEAGRYANRNLADLLAYKRKSGLRVTLAHQYFGQFDDRFILDAIKNLTKIKVMFNTPNPQDHLEMVKALGYGGQIPASLAQFSNADLPKQTAVIKVGKDSPKRIKIPDVPDIEIPRKVEEAYINQCLLHEWCFHPEDVREMVRNRIYDPRDPRTNIQSPEPRKAHDRKAAHPPPVSRRVHPRDDQQGVPEGDETTGATRGQEAIKI
jgi:hypothetical protein